MQKQNGRLPEKERVTLTVSFQSHAVCTSKSLDRALAEELYIYKTIKAQTSDIVEVQWEECRVLCGNCCIILPAMQVEMEIKLLSVDIS